MGIGSYFSSGDCGDNKDPTVSAEAPATSRPTTRRRARGSRPWGDEPRGRRPGPVPVRDRLGNDRLVRRRATAGSRSRPASTATAVAGARAGSSPSRRTSSVSCRMRSRPAGTGGTGWCRTWPRSGTRPRGSSWARPRRSRAAAALRRVPDRRDQPVVPGVRGDHGARRPSEGNPPWVREPGCSTRSRGARRSATSSIPPRRWRRCGRTGRNFLNPHQGQLFTLRSLNQTGTLHTTPGYDDVTGLGSPNGQAFLDAMS